MNLFLGLFLNPNCEIRLELQELAYEPPQLYTMQSNQQHTLEVHCVMIPISTFLWLIMVYSMWECSLTNQF